MNSTPPLEVVKKEKKTLPHIGDTNQQLFDLFQQYMALNGTLVQRMLRSKLNDFHRANYPRYETLQKRMNDLYAKYFVMEEIPHFPFSRPVLVKNEQGDEVPVLNEGLEMQDYEKEFADLMSEPVNLSF
jgi:hypothetical protein